MRRPKRHDGPDGGTQDGRTDVVKLLIASGADVNVKTDGGATALSLASLSAMRTS